MPSIEPSDDARLHRLLDDAAAAVGCELIAVGNASDHVHALVRVSAKITIAALAQRLKGRSSYFGGWHWQRGYFAECIDVRDIADKISYVRTEGRLEVDLTALLPTTSVGAKSSQQVANKEPTRSSSHPA